MQGKQDHTCCDVEGCWSSPSALQINILLLIRDLRWTTRALERLAALVVAMPMRGPLTKGPATSAIVPAGIFLMLKVYFMVGEL